MYTSSFYLSNSNQKCPTVFSANIIICCFSQVAMGNLGAIRCHSQDSNACWSYEILKNFSSFVTPLVNLQSPLVMEQNGPLGNQLHCRFKKQQICRSPGHQGSFFFWLKSLSFFLYFPLSQQSYFLSFIFFQQPLYSFNLPYSTYLLY